MADLPKFMRKMMDTFEEYRWHSILRSHVLAVPEERRARLKTIMELSVELAKVKETTFGSTGLAEGAIEAVIEGDWARVEQSSTYFTFEEEKGSHDPTYADRMNKLYERFRGVLLAAAAEGKRREAGLPAGNN